MKYVCAKLYFDEVILDLKRSCNDNIEFPYTFHLGSPNVNILHICQNWKPTFSTLLSATLLTLLNFTLISVFCSKTNLGYYIVFRNLFTEMIFIMWREFSIKSVDALSNVHKTQIADPHKEKFPSG